MERHNLTRRGFLARSVAAAGAVSLVSASAQELPRDGVDEVVLGGTGMRTSRLGLGTGTIGGREQRLLGSAGFTELVRGAYDRGLRFIDCSDSYWIHGLVRKALEGLPRDELFIQTKTDARDPALVRADIDRFLVELGVDYIDSVLLHCMTDPNFTEDLRPAIDVLAEAKAAGMVRVVGASYHSVEAPRAAVECEALDIHMIRVNPFSVNTDGPPDQVAEVARHLAQAGKGVIGMKVYGESGFDSREKRRESIRHVVSLGCVHAFAIGFSSLAYIEETLELIAEASA